MDFLFEPSWRGYLSYCLGFYARYFAFAGGLVLLLHVLLKQQFIACRVQRAFPPASDVLYEIRWSLINALCTGLSTMVLYQLIRDGHSRMYFTMDERGWSYLFFSIFLAIAGHDSWIYWQHRLLHTDWFYRHAHGVHHAIRNPTPFATFAHHPIETFMGNLYFILLVLTVPLHPWAFIAAGGYMFVLGVNGHLGFELYPGGFTRHPLLGWLNTSTHHNMHHTHENCNYTNWFNFWDWLSGTNHPDYHQTFDRVIAQRQNSRAGATNERPAAAETVPG